MKNTAKGNFAYYWTFKVNENGATKATIIQSAADDINCAPLCLNRGTLVKSFASIDALNKVITLSVNASLYCTSAFSSRPNRWLSSVCVLYASVCVGLPLKLNTALRALSRQDGGVGTRQSTHIKHTAALHACYEPNRAPSAAVLTVQTGSQG